MKNSLTWYQLRLLDSDEQYKCLVGARYTGKSYYVCAELFERIIVPDQNIVVIKPTEVQVNHLRDTFESKYLSGQKTWYSGPEIIVNKRNSIRFDNGTTVRFIPASEHMLRGSYTFDSVLVDDAEMVEENELETILRFAHLWESDVILTGTPPRDPDTLFESYARDLLFETVQISLYDCPFVDAEYAMNMAKSLSSRGSLGEVGGLFSTKGTY